MWSLLFSKTGLYLFLALGIACLVGYHFWAISEKDSIIAEKDSIILEKTKMISDLKINVDRLTLSNKSLENVIKQKEETAIQVINELTAIRNADRKLQQELIDKRRKLEEANKKLESLRQSSKNELLLKTINKSAKCQTEHFGENGVCKNGIWRAAK